MLALPQPKTYYSPEEYLALERAAEFKSENDLTQSLYLAAIGCHLPLSEVYARVQFPAPESSEALG